MVMVCKYWSLVSNNCQQIISLLILSISMLTFLLALCCNVNFQLSLFSGYFFVIDSAINALDVLRECICQMLNSLVFESELL